MQTVTIPAGESLSTPTRVSGGQRLFSLSTADAWDAADLIALVSETEDGVYIPLCKDTTGCPVYLVSFATAKRVAVDAAAMGLASITGWVKFQSVTVADATIPVAQGVAVNIRLDVKA